MMNRREIIEMTDIWNHRVELKMTTNLIGKIVFLQSRGYGFRYIDEGQFYIEYPNGNEVYFMTMRSLAREIGREYRKLKA